MNVNYLKIPPKHRGPHIMPSRTTCGPRVWDPGVDWVGQTYASFL